MNYEDLMNGGFVQNYDLKKFNINYLSTININYDL